jgi:DNA-binding NarL/FixJ family response regulator
MAIRVFHADDHQTFRDGMRLILEREPDVEVVGTAGDGEEAVELARSLEPDVTLMDISMPTLDGIEAARKIRDHLQGARILVLTGSSISADVDRSRQAGVDAFLTKDRLGTQLVDAILDLGSR